MRRGRDRDDAMAPNNALVQDPGRPAATTSSTSVLGNGIVQARGAGVRNTATARPVDDEIAEFLKGEWPLDQPLAEGDPAMAG